MQTQERLHVALLAQKGAIPSRRLLLEETQGRQDDERGPHETQSSRHRGKHLDLAFFFFYLNRVVAFTRSPRVECRLLPMWPEKVTGVSGHRSPHSAPLCWPRVDERESVTNAVDILGGIGYRRTTYFDARRRVSIETSVMILWKGEMREIGLWSAKSKDHGHGQIEWHGWEIYSPNLLIETLDRQPLAEGRKRMGTNRAMIQAEEIKRNTRGSSSVVAVVQVEVAVVS